MKIYIDPATDILYASFYIQGLQEVYGKSAIHYSSKYFKQFKHNNHFFAFVIVDDNTIKRVVVDFTDDSSINHIALDWCDTYGKINIEKHQKTNPKIKSIGPSFGIRFMGFLKTSFLAVFNLLKAYKRIPNKRRFLSDYKAQYLRPKLKDYSSGKIVPNYVFFMASLWKKEKQTNAYRANFIRACKSNTSVNFEGGFAPRTRSDIEGFENLTAEERIPMWEYLEKIKQSFVVFNTPAVKQCHGWKLAEFLALGKSIISTPLSREMPFPLNDNDHLLITDGSENDIALRVDQLRNNQNLISKLERKARSYFESYLAPNKVIENLLSNNNFIKK